MAETHHLSQSAHDRLQSEHDDLTSRGRIEIARKIEAARELGDLSENGDYHAAKEEQGKMEGRIMHLVRVLQNAEIVADQDGCGSEIRSGSLVAVLHDGDAEHEMYLVGSIEEQRDDVTVVSPGSPMGVALVGSSVGDTVHYESPVGMLSIKVVGIE